MAPSTGLEAPGLKSFLRAVSTEPIENLTEYFIALLKRRQIKGSKACALATAYLLRRVITLTRAADSTKLLQRVSDVGKRLVEANPKELTFGNIVRRVLSLIRDEEDEKRGDESQPASGTVTPQPDVSSANGISQSQSSRPALLSQRTATSTAIATTPRPQTSIFSLLSHPTMKSTSSSPHASGASTPTPHRDIHSGTDLRAEVLDGLAEIIDELDQAPDQIATYALDHIHPSETIFTYGASSTVQRFLLKAAAKRKFTVIHAEGYPNAHSKTHAIVTGNHDPEEADMDLATFQKPLIQAGIRVILIPDSNIFGMISRATKVILSAHAVLSNGAFIASSGTKVVVKAAKCHRVPTIVLAATYKLSPEYPYDKVGYVEYGDLNDVVPYQDQEMRRGLKNLRNPVTEVVEGKM